jgi:phenylalanyl-tRNA synthetase beta chain
MKISINWLNDYVDVKEFIKKPEELAKVLIAAGLEVEGIENQAETFKHVVIGHIVELGRHPNADKLTLCQVDTGDGQPRQIVCGAKNHKQGDKVVVALPGAVLPGDFAIKLSKIRDVESQGMLCSESELGFKEESEGIVILPKEAPVGKSFAEYSGRDNVLFEVNVTPNRADCLSHLGLAREVACLLDRELKTPTAKVKAGSKKNPVEVKLNDKEQCPRYGGRALFGVTVGESPEWVRSRLTAVGVNSINNVVDVTNYVMLEYGQPMHAFDADAIKGSQLTIDKAVAKEKFKTFDGTEYELRGDELTIRDRERAVALGGVIGGLNSGVTSATKNIFLEVATFNPKGVRRTSRRLGIETDSSYRYSRGTDPEAIVEVIDRAISLMQEIAGGEASKDHVDIYPNPIKRAPIKVRHSYLNDRLGYDADMKSFESWMKRLHCKTKASGDAVMVEAPSFRSDIEIEVDLVEEYARLNGYDKIPEAFPKLTQRPADHALTYLHEERLANILAQSGYLEARNYNFVNPKWQNSLVEHLKFSMLGVPTGGDPVPVRNPLSEETGVMRQSLLPGLLTNLLHNVNRGEHVGRMFECGYVFGKKSDEFHEPHRFALLAWGHRQDLWAKQVGGPTAQFYEAVIFDVKSALQTLARRLRGKLEFRAVAAGDVPAFIHPGQVSSLFYEGKTIGFMGTLHPAFREEHKIRHDVAVAEVDLSALMRGQPRSPKASAISKYPAVERDVAVLMPTTLAIGELLREIEKAGAPLLQSVQVFDIFRGANVPQGQQSVAFRFVLQDANATLSEAQLQTTTQAILAALEKKGATTRK